MVFELAAGSVTMHSLMVMGQGNLWKVFIHYMENKMNKAIFINSINIKFDVHCS